MKLSKKLNNKIANLTTNVVNFSKDVSGSTVMVDDLDELVTAGDNAKMGINKKVDNAIKKFNKIKTFCKNFAEDSQEISDDIEKISARLDTELESTPEDNKEEIKKFGRKFKVLARRFSKISDNLNNITTEAEAVVNMKPEDVIKPNNTQVNTPKESIDNGTGESAEGAEVSTQPNDVQSEATSVNFSLTNYYNFTINSIRKLFSEIKENLDEVDDVVKDVSDAVEPQPEPEVETTDNATPPPTEEATTAEVEPAPTTESTEETSAAESAPEETVDEKVKEVIEFGEDAILNENDDASDEIAKRVEAIEAQAPGKGEEIVAELENFSKHYKVFKNFSAKTDVYSKIKEFALEACEKAPTKNIDADDLGAKAENLEKMQPGAGELLTSVIECFGKIIDAVKVPVAADAPVAPSGFCMKSFCGTIDKFLSDIKVEDKRFSRELTTKCFALENAIEDDNKEEIKSTANDLALTLDKSDDEVVKAFGEQLVKFAEDAASQLTEKPVEESAPTEEGAVAPEQIKQADEELNKVLDKLDENGEQLKPEVATFTKKLCSAYKSMKCFTEEDLNNKLELVEGLKKDVDDNKVPVESTTTETVEEVPQPKTTLVEETPVEPEDLPSDASLQNFSTTPKIAEDDAFGRFASLEIR